MEIEYKTGDLFAGPEKVIVHGCNSKGAFASGFAAVVRRLYPQARKDYLDHHAQYGLTLGEVIWSDGGDRLIGNAITQAEYGREAGRVYADYDAIRAALLETNEFVEILQNSDTVLGFVDRVALPLIGCGLAGGSWAIVSKIIAEEATYFTPVVYTLDGVIPTS